MVERDAIRIKVPKPKVMRNSMRVKPGDLIWFIEVDEITGESDLLVSVGKIPSHVTGN